MVFSVRGRRCTAKARTYGEGGKKSTVAWVRNVAGEGKHRLPRQRLLPPPLHRRAIAHRLAIFDHGAPGDVVALGGQLLRDRFVGQDGLGVFGLDRSEEHTSELQSL